MKTVEQTRRELFEAWHAGVASEKGVSDELQSSFTWAATKELMLASFNAALGAVCIELPQDKPMSNNHEREAARLAHNDAVDACRTAIESTNLGIKVK